MDNKNAALPHPPEGGHQWADELKAMAAEAAEPATPETLSPADAAAFYRKCLDYSRRTHHTNDGGKGHYTEIHVADGGVVVAPSPVDIDRHFARVHGTHSMLEAMRQDHDMYQDVQPIVDFANQHHLDTDTYVGRASLVQEGDETVLRLYYLNGYTDQAGVRQTDNKWLDQLLELAPQLGIARVERSLGDKPGEVQLLREDDTVVRPHLRSQYVKAESPGGYVPPGSGVGIVTEATLEQPAWRAEPLPWGQPTSERPPLRRYVDSTVTVAMTNNRLHKPLYEAKNQSPDRPIDLEWQDQPLGVRAHYSVDGEAGRAEIGLILNTSQSAEQLTSAIEALGAPVAEAVVRMAQDKQDTKLIDGQWQTVREDVSDYHLRFTLALQPPQGRPQFIRAEGQLSDILAGDAPYGHFDQQRFMDFLSQSDRLRPAAS